MARPPGPMLVGGCEVTEWCLTVSSEWGTSWRSASFDGVMDWDAAGRLLGVEVPVVVASGDREFRGSGFLKSVEKLCDGLAEIEGVVSGPFRVGREVLRARPLTPKGGS